jgi:hypothetical protein
LVDFFIFIFFRLSFTSVALNNMAGQMVGVVFFYGSPPAQSGKVLNTIFTSQPSARWLVEKEASYNVTVLQVVLVRRTIAWLTGIILLISTLLGVRFDISNGPASCFMEVNLKINAG